jgi:hypothetical protein
VSSVRRGRGRPRPFGPSLSVPAVENSTANACGQATLRNRRPADGETARQPSEASARCCRGFANGRRPWRFFRPAHGTSGALSRIVLSQRLAGKVLHPSMRGKVGRIAGALLLLLSVAITTVAPRHAVAGSRSGVVMVSVQVVESCRIETSNAVDGNATDVRMRCNSKARPSLGLTTQSQMMAATGTVSVPYSQITTTENGKLLSIDF